MPMEDDVEVWVLEVQNAYAVRDYFFPDKKIYKFSSCEEYITLGGDITEYRDNSIECAKRVAKEKGAKVVLILDEASWEGGGFILDPDIEKVKKLQKFEANVIRVLREVECFRLYDLLYEGPYDDVFVNAVIERNISLLQDYACKKFCKS